MVHYLLLYHSSARDDIHWVHGSPITVERYRSKDELSAIIKKWFDIPDDYIVIDIAPESALGAKTHTTLLGLRVAESAPRRPRYGFNARHS